MSELPVIRMVCKQCADERIATLEAELAEERYDRQEADARANEVIIELAEERAQLLEARKHFVSIGEALSMWADPDYELTKTHDAFYQCQAAIAAIDTARRAG